MTKKEALERLILLGKGGTNFSEESNEACRIGAAALRKELEAQRSEPLTLEELREMDGEPVYLVGLIERPPDIGGWIIFMSHNDGGFIPRGYGWFTADSYGKDWIAYRKKPEVTP